MVSNEPHDFDDFGAGVAVSISGGTTTVAVGATHGGASSLGAAYIFTSGGGAYTQQAVLTSVGGTPNSATQYGRSIALATSGATTIVAVGAPEFSINTTYFGGAVFLYAGSGSSYPLQTTLKDTSSTTQEHFGDTIALVSSGGTNTLVVGAIYKSLSGNDMTGAAFVFTGSGTSYTNIVLRATAPGTSASGDQFGSSVAVAISGAVVAVVVGAPNTTPPSSGPSGAAYSFIGNSVSGFTAAKLVPATPTDYNLVGMGVAVGFSYSVVEIAVGGLYAGSSTPPGGVLLFSENGSPTAFTQSTLSNTGPGSDGYGTSVAMIVGPNNGPIVVGGAPNGQGNAQIGAATISQWDASASVRAVLGDASQAYASPGGAHTGSPFHIVASLVDGNGTALTGQGITFTVNPTGSTGGLFDPNTAGSTTLHVLTNTADNATTGVKAGQTDIISLYPSDTAGTFTVTATADGTSLNTTYTLKILAVAPVPTINAVIPPRAVSALPAVAPHVATPPPAPGLSPPAVFIDPTVNYPVLVNGTGFVSQALGTTAFFQHGSDTRIQMDCVFNNSTQLMVFVSGPQGMFTGLSVDTTATITVYNPPKSGAGGTDGGYSNPVTIVLAQHHLPPNNSTVSTIGATTLLAAPGLLYVPAPLILTTNGAVVTVPVTGIGVGLTGAKSLITQDGATLISEHGAGVISNDGATIIAQGGGNIIAQGGGNIIAQGGGNVIRNDGGRIIAQGGGNLAEHTVSADTVPVAQSPPAPAPSSQGSVAPRALAPRVFTPTSSIGDYIASTDANGVIMAPAVRSNGVPGTFTCTFAVDGIATPITYTIINLNPHDGQPTTITALSKSSAVIGGAAFDLAVTGTGFIGGSVLSFGGVQLATTVDSATHVHATIPASLLNYPGALDVVVINPDSPGLADGGASFASLFTVTAPPTLTTLTLPAGSTAGGATVTLTGTNFAAGATVSFGGLTGTNVTVVNSTTLTVITPAHGAGVVDVSVVSSGVTLTQAYTYGNIAPQPIRAPAGTPKPGGVSVQPPREPPGATLGAGTPTPVLQPLRH